MLLLQADDEASVKRVIEKVNAGVKQPFYFDNDSKPTVVSMSVGVAFYPQTSRNLHELIKLADIAMYKAKQNKIASPNDYLIFAAPETRI